MHTECLDLFQASFVAKNCFPGKGFILNPNAGALSQTAGKEETEIILNPNAGALSQTAGKEETEIINSLLLRDCAGHDNLVHKFG